MGTANEDLLDATIRHQIQLLRFSSGEAQQAVRLLQKSDEEIVKAIQSGLTETSEKRLKALLVEVRRLREQTIKAMHLTMQENLDGLADNEHAWEMEAMQGVSPVQLSLNAVQPSVLKAVASSPINGIPLTGWLGQMAATDVSRIEQQVRLGVLQGETIDQVTRRVVGPNGVTNLTRRNAETIARTAVNHVSTMARQATWEANEDIIEGIRWVSTLDGRTSSVCQSRDGIVYPVRKGPRPPAHPNCRSTTVPVLAGDQIIGDRPSVTDVRTRKAREIDFRADAKTKAGASWSSLSASQRNALVAARRKEWTAANIGTTPSSVNYDTWLRRQSKAFQNKVLGPGKAKLFREGATLDKFVDTSGKPLSLQKLKAGTQGAALNVVQPGVGMKAKALLQTGATPQQVLDQIQKEFPDAKTSLASIASYKVELKKAGLLDSLPINLTNSATGDGAIGQVMNNWAAFDAQMTPSLKTAIGGNWSSLAKELPGGAPGAYAHYQAGKGVTFDMYKMASISPVQQQQVMAHELSHLLNEQHGVLNLTGEALNDLDKALLSMSPSDQKLYSYFLSSPAELQAEILAQAIKPSAITSQGLSASGFNKTFAPWIDKAKESLAKKFPVPNAAVLKKSAASFPPVGPYEVAGNHTTVGSLAKALLKQGMPDEQVLKAIKAQFPDAKTTQNGIATYKSQLKAENKLQSGGSGPVVAKPPLTPAQMPTPEPVAVTVADSVPSFLKDAPLTYKASLSFVKEKGIELMSAGVMDTKDVLQIMTKQFPANQLTPGAVSTWKSLWKKANPDQFAKAELKAKTLDKKSLLAGPPKPKLSADKLGPVATKAYNELKNLYAYGHPSVEHIEGILQKVFKGSYDVNKAQDLIQLAKYDVDTAKAAAKPYVNATMKAPGPSVVNVELKVTEAVINNNEFEAVMNDLIENENEKLNWTGLMMDPEVVADKLALKYGKGVLSSKNLDVIAKTINDFDLDHADAAVFKDNLVQIGEVLDKQQIQAKQIANGKTLKIQPLTPAQKAVLKNEFKGNFGMSGETLLENLNAQGLLENVTPGEMYSLFSELYQEGYKHSGIVEQTIIKAVTEKQELLKQKAVAGHMTPSRPAATPWEGKPPPPRYTSEQHAYALQRLGDLAREPSWSKKINARYSLVDQVTPEEAAAIRSYTGNKTYMKANASLRAGGYAHDPILQAYVDAAQSGLRKIPPYRGEASRGMRWLPPGETMDSFLKNYRVGSVVEEHAFTSSSQGSQAAYNGPVYFKIKSLTGRDVDWFSRFSGGEREVLFMPGTRFKITNVERAGGRSTIYMEEVPE